MRHTILRSLLLPSLFVAFDAPAQTQVWSAPATQAAPPEVAAPGRAVATGEAVMAASSGGWYRATVLEVGASGYKVRYDGWGAGWDEWLPPARLRLPDGTPVVLAAAAVPAPAAPLPPAATPATPFPPGSVEAPRAAPVGAYQVGDRVWVSWIGTSQRARILEQRNGQYLIRYEGYDSKWDEWVAPGRITGRVDAPAAQAQAPSTAPAPAATSGTGARTPSGRWECATWDAGALNRIGGFTLHADGSYQDQNSRASGRYTYQAASGRIAFTSGPQKTNAPVTFQPEARGGAGMIVFDYGGGARLDCYRAAAQ